MKLMTSVIITLLALGVQARPAHKEPSASQLTVATMVGGKMTFSSNVISAHAKTADDLSYYGAECLKRYERVHNDFYETQCAKGKCLSKFYGDRAFTKVRGGRRADGKVLTYLPDELQSKGFSPAMAKEMQGISCIGLALNCLEESFRKTGQAALWNDIAALTRANGVTGTSLLDGLQRLGWKVYFWNPDPSVSSQFDKFDRRNGKREKPAGDHAATYNTAKNGHYWAVTVNDAKSLVNFGRTTPDLIKEFPFWVATANIGYHVFPGSRERVLEAHSTRPITSRKNLEFSDFNPLENAYGVEAGPVWTNSEKYLSGIIAVPPIAETKHSPIINHYAGSYDMPPISDTVEQDQQARAQQTNHDDNMMRALRDLFENDSSFEDLRRRNRR